MPELAIISVHVQFPKIIVLDTKLDVDPTNWEWKKCLAFPVSRLNELGFSLKPYKWIRYATGIVVGARGDLALNATCTNPFLSTMTLASLPYPLTFTTIPPTQRSVVCF